MPLQLSSYSQSVSAVLAASEGRTFPLIHSARESYGMPDELRGKSSADLFSGARFPAEALSGLLLRLNCWEESHKLSQDLNTAEGSYWHGIAHRLEPDYGNASYWFRRVGRHAIFPRLQTAAVQILHGKSTPWIVKDDWDPLLLIRWCEEANRGGDRSKMEAATAIQIAEWELLFDWCATPITSASAISYP